MFTISSSVLLISCLLQVALSFTPQAGDANVRLYKDEDAKKQLHFFLGDQFLVNISSRGYGHPNEFKNINHVNVTQRVLGLSEDKNVTIVLQRVEKHLFNVTRVYPVSQVGGKNQTVVTASQGNMYFTELGVRNTTDATLPNSHIHKIVLTSFGIVTVPGARVEISPLDRSHERRNHNKY
uniref:Uncharacterized protein n=1 Tax=Cacopsylla melanoneura TaxID=428564 RepID=A0A8D8XAX3_9HEMI